MAISIATTGRAACESSEPTPELSAFEWTNVRSDYRSLHAEFWRLTDPFGIELTPDLSLDLAHLIAAMDAVDRELDGLAERSLREQFSRQVVSFLANESPWQYASHSETNLAGRLVELRRVMVRRHVQLRFAATVQSIFRLSEEKRNACAISQYMQLVRREWRLAGELPILILGRVSTPRFESFFFSLCETMHAVDTVLDARNDYRSGLIAVRPGPVFYAMLVTQLAIHVAYLLFKCPSRLQLVRYAVGVCRGRS